ncbi:MAG: hypothetical protein JXR51_10580 [Bacteroidales bacterium]|nr:hypothetical protein [Bacteroidales bacterium]MBN2757612.1 hypothetical protein [Bacteroidales bacterium]
MKIFKAFFNILLVLLIFECNLSSQTNISVKFLSLTYEFDALNSVFYNRKLNEKGSFCLESGLIFSFEAYSNENTAIKFSQSLFYDKLSQLSANTQIMIKFKLIKHFKNSLYVGIGPNFQLRKARNSINGYIDEAYYENLNDLQYKISWLSAEIEYNYYLNKKTDLSISINHIQPKSIGLAVGLKYWINKVPKKKRGCISCPGSH